MGRGGGGGGRGCGWTGRARRGWGRSGAMEMDINRDWAVLKVVCGVVRCESVTENADVLNIHCIRARSSIQITKIQITHFKI